MSATAMHDEDLFEATMNAVIIYEERDCAKKVSALLQRASDRADAGTQWSVKPWRLDLLSSAPLANDALRDASEAHLMLLAVGGKAEFPAELLDWLEAWAAQRQVQDAVLAVYDVGSSHTIPARATPALSDFAHRNGLSVIFGGVAPEKGEPAKVWEDLHEREVARTPTLEHILEQPEH